MLIFRIEVHYETEITDEQQKLHRILIYPAGVQQSPPFRNFSAYRITCFKLF